MTDIGFVFITLVYRNYGDIKDLCKSLKKHVKDSYKVIVVDAFYDDVTSEDVKNISAQYGCDYLSIENKGYGYGNNRGLDYALGTYSFKWAVICNPDTVLSSDISLNKLRKSSGIVAPNIIARNGKHQNPYWAYKNTFAERLIYLGYLKDNKPLMYCGVGINKVLRECFLIVNSISGKFSRIYACHGSFVILSKKFLDDSGFRYDEDMFLFYEEPYLAYVARNNGITTEFRREMVVRHKEDGSMDLAKISEYPYLKKSYVYFYETYIMNK